MSCCLVKITQHSSHGSTGGPSRYSSTTTFRGRPSSLVMDYQRDEPGSLPATQGGLRQEGKYSVIKHHANLE